MMDTPKNVTALRARLWDSGFRPVGIYNHNIERILPEQRGKAPMGQNWQTRAQQTPPEAAITDAHPDALNTGIWCEGLRAIDIDIDNPTIAASVKTKAYSLFGEAPMRYRNNSPRVLLLYRAAEGAPKKRVIHGTFGKVEVLGTGQQFVAYGVHPSGADLLWMPEGPSEATLESLTAITEAQVEAFLAASAESIGAQPLPKSATGTQASSSRGLRADTLQVVAALSAIPNAGLPDWEGWNRIGMASYAATGGSEGGRAAFHAWSEQNPAYDPNATNERWENYRISPPTEIGAGTLFHMARQGQPVRDDAGPTDEPEDLWIGLDRVKEPFVAKPKDANEQEWRVVIPSRLHGLDVPVRRWLVEDWLPRRQVTLNYADGGIGKTLLAMQLMAATALGKPWCGLQVEQCSSIGLFSEDDTDELHIRLDAIRRFYDVEFPAMDDMVLIDGTGQNNLLVVWDGQTLKPTPRLIQLREHALDIRANLVVIDTAATTFGGNEIDRTQVTLFIGSFLTKLAQDLDGAVLLNAHPSVAGMMNGNMTSGSTAWNGSARSRWAMTRPDDEDGNPKLDSIERILTRRKSNGAAAGETISLEWRNGVFMTPYVFVPGGSSARKDNAEQAFMNGLMNSVRPLSDNKISRNFAPRIIHATPFGCEFQLPELVEALRNLMSRGEIIVVEYVENHRTGYQIRPAKQPV